MMLMPNNVEIAKYEMCVAFVNFKDWMKLNTDFPPELLLNPVTCFRVYQNSSLKVLFSIHVSLDV